MCFCRERAKLGSLRQVNHAISLERSILAIWTSKCPFCPSIQSLSGSKEGGGGQQMMLELLNKAFQQKLNGKNLKCHEDIIFQLMNKACIAPSMVKIITTVTVMYCRSGNFCC